jgi:hypothetical protein
MPLMAEYALTPGIFDGNTFPEATRDELIYSSFALLREIFNNEGLVRNLYGGAWKDLFRDGNRNWHFKGKELLRKLIEQNRLIIAPQVLASFPTTEKEWCEEALASPQPMELGGIVTTDEIAAQYPRTHQQIAAINRLPSAHWWSKRESTVRVTRTAASYIDHLRPLLMSANLLSFIDPHIDPRKSHYRDFSRLIQEATHRCPLPLIQIHRAIGEGRTDWKAVFDAVLGPIVRATGVRIELYIWDEMHDRYMISDIVGISMLNGFDTTRRTDSMGRTTWNRMSRAARDEVLRDYDDAAHLQKFRGQNHFIIQPI